MAAAAALRAAKDAVRSELKKKLSSLSLEERTKQSKIVAEQLLQNERFKGSNRISIYLSTEHEVQTEGILKHLFDVGKEVFIPKYDTKSHLMEMVKLHSMEDFSTLPLTSWKIKQPADDDVREEALATGGLDLMLVPGLAFTKRGHRIGRGKGYYDHYYNRCLHDPNGRPYTVALAFREQILHSIPLEEHDFVVDEVIYPE
ncbi:5-formyltetrahydrofolate cyclo-ligase-like [Centruroides sculpturatus]|uniref:5-formyltetrahydrofolate cyclo-ligase-like n=1 Tax=Centruroides sculpturatus TaxID=218467 RepID=UPI000C6E1EC5|nr:5-formyltetrahydrofolate cyclo-ligase-like [Centruroides sculpturatus]